MNKELYEATLTFLQSQFKLLYMGMQLAARYCHVIQQ